MNGKCLAARKVIETGEALRPLGGQVLVARMALYISPMSPKAGLKPLRFSFPRSRGNAFRDAPRHTVLRLSEIQARLESPFRPSATYLDGAKVGKTRSSVSGPTSSGSFALSLIRGSPQRALHGPVRLTRRPAELPPDQRQNSAVTNVAICVVSAIAIKKRFCVQ